jgi:hypothetical protein
VVGCRVTVRQTSGQSCCESWPSFPTCRIPLTAGEQCLYNSLAALCEAGEVTVCGLSRPGGVPEGWPLAERFSAPPYIVRRDTAGEPDDPTTPLKRLITAILIIIIFS